MSSEPDPRLDVVAFDLVSAEAALELVRPLCASPAWMDALVARRPYGSLDAVLQTSATVLAVLSGPQLEKALAGAGIAVPMHEVGVDTVELEAGVRSELIAHVADRVRETLV